MILSDRDLRAAMEAGRLRIEPLGENAIQPSSIDLRIGSEFRVFANNRYPYIDVRKPMDDLTELVTVDDPDEPFILHPGEFVLGTTLETVTIPDDMVARLEGKSSLARLGLLIHSSLPGDEEILFLHEGELRLRPIEEIVRKQLVGQVVSFDPDSFETIFADVTGWFEGPEDRIFEVVLASGRSVRVTAGHNLFTLDTDGEIHKVRTGQLQAGSLVAVPCAIPTPPPDVAVVASEDMAPSTEQASSEEVRVGGLIGDAVVEVRDTGRRETIYDLEVRPNGRPIENFLAGTGGVFVSNTAGFVDAGWSGHLTLELSNVANLPITLYPGMKIGQLAFFPLTSPAEHPYGSSEIGSKYQGQRGPTPSRYFENFDREPDDQGD